MPRRISLFRLPAIAAFPVIAAFILSAVLPAHAGPLSFMVNPMTIELTGQPGAAQTGVITIDNSAPTGDAPLRLRIAVSDWTLDRRGTPQTLPAGTQAGSCSGWLEINPLELEVPPGQSRELRYTLHVPVKADGNYRTMLLFEKAPEPMQSGSQRMVITGRIATVLYLQVGPQVRRARITGFSVAAGKTLLTVENTGNSQVRVSGVLQFAGDNGRIAARQSLPNSVILPGTDNLRDISLPAPSLTGLYTVTALLDYGGDVLAGARTHVQLP